MKQRSGHTHSVRKLNKSKPAAKQEVRSQSRVTIDAPSAVISDRPKLLHEQELISTALEKHFIFSNLNKSQKKDVMDHMKHFSLVAGEIVFEQGQPAHNFFVVGQGELEVLAGEHSLNTLALGDSFGEVALMHDLPRSATVKTITPVALWGLDRRTFRQVLQFSSLQSYTENKAFIESVPIFQFLKTNEKDALLSNLQTTKFTPGMKIVKEGDIGDLLYIIKEGTVTCSKDGQAIRTMTKGDFFGEQALLFQSPRTATITADTLVKCVVISREKLAQTFGRNLLKVIYRNSQLMAIERSPVLALLSCDQRELMMKALKIMTYRKGETVVRQGELQGGKLWILLYGRLRSQDGLIDVLQCIGDTALTGEGAEIFPAAIVAEEDSDVAEISREDLEHTIGGPIGFATSNNDAVRALKRAQLFKALPIHRLRTLVGALKQETFEEGEVIVRQQDPGNRFYIVRTGVVDVVVDGLSKRHIAKLDYFGERSILFNEPRTATVVALSRVQCWVLYQEDFFRVIDESIRYQLTKRIELQDDSITLDDLVFVKPLGQGMFGNVSLVAHKETHRLYALKTVDRRKIDAFKIHESILLERSILLEMDHNLILKLVKTFKDEERIYFLMEYVNGCDLFDALRIMNLLNEKDSKFYSACLINMVEHLHDRNVIYRDLKPENVMVDEEGYLKLIDFGTAKEIHGRTFTIIGTPHYMSPESILGKGYSTTADYWSIGVMIYEFLCGCLPFGDDIEDPLAVYESVVRRKLGFPKFLKLSKEVVKLIEQLLSKNPMNRTGGSVDNLKNHPWFHHFNWEALDLRQLSTPFKPEKQDFSRQLTKARNNVRTAIREEERGQEIPKNMRMRAVEPPLNWDAEF